MTILQSSWATGQRTTPVGDCAADVVAQLFEFALPAAALAADDIIELGVLPANNSPTDATLIVDKLDSGGTATIAFDVGVMSGQVGDKVSARTCGAELFGGSNVGQAGGTVRASLASAFTLAPSDVDRSIGVRIKAAAAAQVAGAKVRLLLTYRAV
ncbi:hypothetical protein [Burkholderia multivorans]|uniref:hypothetical protein n=1 Tax=Burkholderia multivorans TaxID=87883 RepID=UPI001C23F5F3|nr:hypothetical protein [Burkholderia multivorans]ULR75121.1 virion-associated protein [Burkholderia phage JC1]MBU9386635.1 hypothetical protein [Burkholderia multivorans]MBU9437069.1 hypothetical protein [Burkholderia multivorans]MBU9606274.1 hypothetical protein [Burkholderia multivorans]MBU9624833.1 hypothetical protein [Burkholderia multivorans]